MGLLSDDPRANVVARRVSCDAPVAHADRIQRFTTRAVPLAGGDSVVLAQPRPRGRVAAGRLADGTYEVRGVPAGLFVGATKLRVRVNRGDTVSVITVDYPSGTDYAAIVARFTRELGTPTMRDTIAIPNSGGLQDEMVAWETRTTGLVLWRSNLAAGGFAVSVILTDDRLGP